MAINSLSTGFRPGVCTSSTRPTAPYTGQIIYETDTGQMSVWSGSVWNPINPNANRNLIFNGNFDIWQRGLSFSTDNAATAIYTADRWCARALYPNSSAVQTITQETTNIPAGSKFSLKSVVATAAAVNNSRMQLCYTVEPADAIRYAGKQMMLSMQIKAIQNINQVAVVPAYSTTGGKSFDGTSISTNYFTVTTSGFTTCTVSFTLPSAATLTTSGTIGFYLSYTRSSGAAEQIGDGIYLSQVQLEPGNQATSFEVRPVGTELALCQRYYWQWNSAASGENVLACGAQTGSTTSVFAIHLPVEMRSKPTVAIPTMYVSDQVTFTTLATMQSATNTNANTKTLPIYVSHSAVGAQFRPLWFIALNASGTMNASAEL